MSCEHRDGNGCCQLKAQYSPRLGERISIYVCLGQDHPSCPRFKPGLAKHEGENMETRKAPRNTVYVGSKPVMNYCLAVMSCLQQGSETVILKARGRAISTAVDVAEVTRNRFLQDLTISGIEIGTEQVESSEGQNRTRNVSTIEITLKKG